jgi:hypothetical protein
MYFSFEKSISLPHRDLSNRIGKKNRKFNPPTLFSPREESPAGKYASKKRAVSGKILFYLNKLK